MRRILTPILLAAMLAGTPAGAVSLPPQFVVENAVPGVAFDSPTAVAFLPGGRMLVAEKRGRVWAVTNGVRAATPMWQRESEVLNQGDRGLLGLAVDPGYATNRFIYLLYTVDPDSDGVDSNDDAFGRLVRYQVSASDSNIVSNATRTVLIGTDWRHGAVSASSSHTIGDLHFGSDGSLLVSAGDAAQFNATDRGGADPQAFGPTRTDPYEDIGAFRAQSLSSLDGKILRLNPATGLGLPSNPWYDGDAGSVRSRVWANGLRNPFRFALRPNTGSADPAAGDPGTLYIGDVGYNTWEEIDVLAAGGKNFGWPCYEGFGTLKSYQDASPAHNGCDSFGTADNPAAASPPLASWHHSDATLGTPPGLTGNCSIGGVFYTGTLYPAQYRQQYFFADYGAGWMKVARLDGSDRIVDVLDFGEGLNGPVDLALEPGSGDIVYVAIDRGEVRRIRYVGSGGNAAPIALASGTPRSGAVPLQVSFSSAGSYDPDGDAFSIAWNFGDGQGSTGANPVHAYGTAGTWRSILTLDDGQGGIGRDTVLVVAGAPSAFPVTAVLDDFNRANGPLGSSWTDPVFGSDNLAVQNNSLVQSCCAYAAPVWTGGPFESNQEAYVRFTAVTANAPEQDLMLKLQSRRYDAPHLEVKYDAVQGTVSLSTFDGTSWTGVGAPIAASLAAGDRLGARAYASGVVGVYKNGVEIGSADIGGWPGASQGGWIGLTLNGAYSSRLDDFGGGTVTVSGDTPPTATILTPAGGSFFAVGDRIALSGAGVDAEQAGATLDYEWVADLHHNNHVHPSSFVAGGPNATMIGENHDDGTGVWYEIELRVTDSGALSDTARVDLFPEIDLVPEGLTSTPGEPGTTAPAVYSFSIRNRGRMPAPFSHWHLVADGLTLAQGDTLVPALGRVTVRRTVRPVLAAGDHVLRLTVDSLATIFETDETNDALARPLTVVEGDGGGGGAGSGLGRVTLTGVIPNPSRGEAALTLDLPRAARVTWSVHDLQGRVVWSEPGQRLEAGHWLLVWPGVRDGGGRAAAGLYFVRVEAEGRSFTRRIALVR